MKKAASIFLRTDIYPEDVARLIRWMEKPNITRYLNEESGVASSLRRLLDKVPAPMLTYHFNRMGLFFLICRTDGEAIGFIKLRERPQSGHFEIVYAIGEETLWGRGYGAQAIRSALDTAFCQWRARQVVAKIYPENLRSVCLVTACGFRRCGKTEQLLHFSMTMEGYLKSRGL